MLSHDSEIFQYSDLIRSMQAETAPSLLYDYYNPEVSVTVRPSRFDVTPGKESMAPEH